jgi:methionyl aminopeptidase
MNYVAAKDAPGRSSGLIKLHEPEDFAGMAKAGHVAALALDAVGDLVVPGVTTEALDTFCSDFGHDHDAISAPLNYRGYTKSICTSINNVICHGIPSSKALKSGDIVNIDVTYIIDGWHGDSSRMFLVGDVPLKARRLVDITYEALQIGIAQVKPGNTTGDIGAAIQEFVEGHRYSVVRDFCGHGIGRVFHDMPNVLHYGEHGKGLTLKEGMFFTIEPMVNLGKPGVKMKPDGWTAVTRDRSLSAQFEHSIGVTADGCQIFTASPKGYTKPPYGE